MMQIKKAIMMVAMLLFITLYLIMTNFAQAAEERTATLNWNNPTQYTDNSPLDQADIAGYYIYWEEGVDPSPNNPTTSRIQVPADGGIAQYIATFMMQPRPEPYVYHFRISVYLKDGRESSPSNVAIKDFGVVKSSALPNAPQGLSVSQ